jgi:CheY-like chemotaxis protein
MSTSDEAKQTILVVDDEPDVVSYLEMVLQDAGYRTVTAANGREGMAVVRRERPSLVVLDISMPEASGTRMYKELKTDPELGATPVVIVTAVTGYGGDPRGYEKFLGGRKLVPPPEAFFPKPIEPEGFVRMVRALLAGGVSAAT